ncbi:MAG: asparagine synthase (glutamine-hydrolyzing) [Deltaproteobacteria bacterium]|nr:asparagine synthase (glutamine-hydrolyzing) [Deltaproteobacteria bacterium]
MCGIAGLVSVRPDRVDADAVARVAAMRDLLHHRGPDDRGFWRDPVAADAVAVQGGCVFGFARLSIVDLQGGHQPMGNEDGAVQIVFNGEIYNHLELRSQLQTAGHVFATRSDTEVLIHGWEEWGTSLLQRCNGMFDLALWDGHRRQLFLARDRFGKKPLFVGVCDRGDTLVFGTELSAVRAHPAVDDAIDPHGLLSLLVLDYVAAPRSMLRHVHAVEPGAFWLWSANGGKPILTQGLWHPPRPADPDLAPTDPRAAQAELQRLIIAATERRLMAEVPLGIFLSGGIDSSLVAWAAAQVRSAADIDTFAIGFDDPSFDESAHARAVARHLGTRHHERVLSADKSLALVPEILARLDQPLADPSIVPTWFLCGFARERVTVALGGDGGDEWFLGYPSFAGHRFGRVCDAIGVSLLHRPLQMVVDRLPVSHQNWSLDYQTKRFVTGLGQPPALRHFAWIGGWPIDRAVGLLSDGAREALRGGDGDAALARPDLALQVEQTWQAWRLPARDDFDALAGLYARYYLADGVLQKVDRASMAHSLEARAPLLDPDVVAFARALPTGQKLRGRTAKWALRQLAADKLPADIVRRPKKGFGVPLGAWLRGPLHGWMRDVLAPHRVAQSGLLDTAAVARLIEEHAAGRADHRKVLWALLTFEAWRQRPRPGL